jgi:hypothetical protein
MQRTPLVSAPEELSAREQVIADLASELSATTKQAHAIDLDYWRKNALCDEEIQALIKAAALFTYWNQANKAVASVEVRPIEPTTLFDSTPYFFEGTA